MNIEKEDDQLNIYKHIVKEELSVRRSEKLVQELKNTSIKSSSKNVKISSSLPFSIQKIALDIGEKINSNIEIKIQKSGKGNIIISFKDEDQLEQIIHLVL